MTRRLRPAQLAARRDALLVAFIGEAQPLTPLVRLMVEIHPGLFHNSGDVREEVRAMRDDRLIETVPVVPPRRVNSAGVDVAASSVRHHRHLTIAGEAQAADLLTRARAHAREASSP